MEWKNIWTIYEDLHNQLRLRTGVPFNHNDIHLDCLPGINKALESEIQAIKAAMKVLNPPAPMIAHLNPID